MQRQSIFERMQRELDFTKEYLKLEHALCNEHYGRYQETINDVFEENFRRWKFRDNYMSLKELRDDLGFNPSLYFEADAKKNCINENSFFQFCEMILNLADVFKEYIFGDIEEGMSAILETIIRDLEKVNYCFEELDDGRIIVAEKCAAATAVSEIVPQELSGKVIEYNHFLLRENIAAKRSILLSLAGYLEPKRKTLRGLNSTIEDNVFYLINNLNIRHNNGEKGPNYKMYVADMKATALEEWYDETYQTMLFAILTLDQVERNRKIEELKTHIADGK